MRIRCVQIGASGDIAMMPGGPPLMSPMPDMFAPPADGGYLEQRPQGDSEIYGQAMPLNPMFIHHPNVQPANDMDNIMY